MKLFLLPLVGGLINFEVVEVDREATYKIRAGDGQMFEPLLTELLSHFNNLMEAYQAQEVKE